MTTDEALMLQFRSGSQEAFDELFDRYREPLFGFFRRRLGDGGRADDLAQETFLAVIRGTERYQPRSLFRTYLYGIAMKLLAVERRKLQRESPPAGPEPAANDHTDALLWVREALDLLEGPEREILMLREYEQLGYAEIAELMRIPLNTVRSRLFRARMALKSHLALSEAEK
jgi:RNA polymerase sigma-70 factor (ECF subfamily)